MLEVYGLTPRTEHTIIDRHRLFAEFADIRQSGVACDREESIRGGICYAAAIRSGEREAKAAISVSTPTTRMDRSREEEVRAAVLEAAGEIGRKL
jgi:DNA-binding IclR family transcriptional regulator